MAAQQHLFGLVGARGKIGRSALVGMPFLHHRPMRAHDFVARRPATKTKHLISLILGHPARKPSTALPRVSVDVLCRTPSGKAAVQVRLKEREALP